MTDVSPEIRLACMNCDRDDFDGTTLPKAEAAGWEWIDPSRNIYDSEWWTHLGFCKECSDIIAAEEARLTALNRLEDNQKEKNGGL